ncbi:MAG TPA: hypothetical protein VHQ45_15530 [Gemmatimonadaceae bacterium]|nr:hypothetical protein [Gemmatimonadaceae bacterium]
MAVGFRGFGDEADAVHAAWVGYRTLSRRFAHARGRRPIPIDTEPMSLGWSGDVELILAGGRPIATLVRPGADSPSGPTSFGFELQVPVPADEPTVRSIAYLIYRTMRRAGIRWAMWTPAPPVPSVAPAGNGEAATADLPRTAADRAAAGPTADRHRAASSSSVATALVIVAVLAMIALPAITTSNVMFLLGGGAVLLALLALASFVRLVVTDTRDALRQRGRPTPGARPGGLRSPDAARVTGSHGGAWARPRMLSAEDGAIQGA